MKYKHEFAIKHLPFTILGVIGFVIGFVVAVATVHGIFNDAFPRASIVLGVMLTLLGCVVGGVSLANGVEYTSTLAPELVDPPKKKHYTTEDIDRRREEVLSYDFEPTEKELKQAALHIEKQKKAKLLRDDLS